MASKRLCEGLNAKGRPCRQWAQPGRPYCARHDPDLSEEERGRRLAGKWGRVDWAEVNRLRMNEGPGGEQAGGEH